MGVYLLADKGDKEKISLHLPVICDRSGNGQPLIVGLHTAVCVRLFSRKDQLSSTGSRNICQGHVLHLALPSLVHPVLTSPILHKKPSVRNGTEGLESDSVPFYF